MPTQSTSLTTSDGLDLYTAAWLPEGTPRAVVVIVHGIAEHCTRYDYVAEAFAAAGYAAYSYDQRGHGRSAGERTVFDMAQLVADLDQFARRVRSQHPDAPFYLFGHSMGSLVALLYLLDHPDVFDGFISSGTPIALGSVPSVLRGFVRAVDAVAPRLRLIPLKPANIALHAPTVDSYSTDPLVDHGATRVHAIRELVEGGVTVSKRAAELRLPMLILQGEEDRIVPPEGSAQLYALVSSADKTLKLYPKLYHEICNEAERDEVIADMLAWLDTHTPNS